MQKAKTGIVAVASHFESGGQRAQALIEAAVQALENTSVAPVAASKIVWDAADCIDVCKEFKKQNIDSYTIILSTWVTDSLLFTFEQEMADVPMMLWAVPYTETFSIGCVQHFGSVMTTHGVPYEYVYGLPENAEVVEKVVLLAEVGQAMKRLRNARLALIGPRQTWRVAGPQDSTNEEWEFSQKFGVTLVHIEMEEILALANEISDTQADSILRTLQKRTGKVLAGKEAMRHMAKVFNAIQKIIRRYSLDMIAAECYPYYSGLMNLPSSWLADEGFVLDTEGDIGHATIMYLMNLAAKGGATALGEVGSLDDANNVLALAHEGSSAHSLAEKLELVQISPSGEKGAFVGLPLKPMDVVTVASIQGCQGRYQLLVETASVAKATCEEWVAGGEKLLVKLKLKLQPSEAVRQLIAIGLDHHLLVKEGDHTEFLRLFCKFAAIREVAFQKP